MDSEDSDECNDVVAELNNIDINKVKPDMFVSGWEDPNDDVNEDQNPQATPERHILWAASENKIDIVEMLLKENPELVHCKDNDGYTPLHKAAYNDNYEMAMLLLKYNADPNARTQLLWTPLHSALKWNNTKCAALLLQNGSDINALSEGNQTPLHVACSVTDCQKSLITLFMEPNLKLNLENNSEEKASDLAKRSGLCYPLFKMAHTAFTVETGLIE
jgi:ankyrin repeat domain-containing protein 49